MPRIRLFYSLITASFRKKSIKHQCIKPNGWQPHTISNVFKFHCKLLQLVIRLKVKNPSFFKCIIRWGELLSAWLYWLLCALTEVYMEWHSGAGRRCLCPHCRFYSVYTNVSPVKHWCLSVTYFILLLLYPFLFLHCLQVGISTDIKKYTGYVQGDF